jgi:peroxiredoxin
LVAQQPAIVAQPKVDPAAAAFDQVLREALGALAKAGSYAVDVDCQWGAVGDPQGPQGASRYRLVSQGPKYRVEMQSQAAAAAELVCVNDGSQVTTYFPARKLYAQHAAGSPEAALEANTMLAMSLQGSALDLLLARDVAGAVRAQASGLKDRGQEVQGGRKVRRFELVWAGGQVQLWFAAEGDPLLLKYTRTTTVPTATNTSYQMVCTANFRWQLGIRPAEGTFALALPSDARRVKEIYAALSGEESNAQVGQPLPKLRLAGLDGNEVELAATANKKATVLVFWATWCAASVEDMPALQKFVTAYQQRGVQFYAVNVGEPPGEVRRFAAKNPLASTVLLDPRGTASSALRICELPAVAVIGPDNTVLAVHEGPAKTLQADLSGQLETLLSSSTSSTARRPAATGAKKK